MRMFIFLFICLFQIAFTSKEEADSIRAVIQDPVSDQIAMLDESEYCTDYGKLIDWHLQTKLGEDMRKSLDELKQYIEKNPSKFVQKRKEDYEKASVVAPAP